jgi:predicted DCC family thiol-disulfide oxidoreductase YuxK
LPGDDDPDRARSPSAAVLILWDHDCGFCAWTLAKLLRADPRGILRTAPIQGPEGDRHLAHMTPERRLASWHVLTDDGALASGGAALIAVLAQLPAARGLATLTARAPSMTDRAYRWVARHRSLLSRAIPAKAKRRARDRVQARSSSAGPVDAGV